MKLRSINSHNTSIKIMIRGSGGRWASRDFRINYSDLNRDIVDAFVEQVKGLYAESYGNFPHVAPTKEEVEVVGPYGPVQFRDPPPITMEDYCDRRTA